MHTDILHTNFTLDYSQHASYNKKMKTAIFSLISLCQEPEYGIHTHIHTHITHTHTHIHTHMHTHIHMQMQIHILHTYMYI